MWNNAIDGIAHRHAPSFAFALPPLLPPPSPPSPLAFGDCVAALRCACSSRTSSSEAAFFDATSSTDDGIVNAPPLNDSGIFDAPPSTKWHRRHAPHLERGVVVAPTLNDGIFDAPPTSNNGIFGAPTSNDGIINTPHTSNDGIVDAPPTSNEIARAQSVGAASNNKLTRGRLREGCRLHVSPGKRGLSTRLNASEGE